MTGTQLLQISHERDLAEFYGPRWLMSGRPVRETPSRRARRPEDAARLWAMSEELTGTTFDPAPTS